MRIRILLFRCLSFESFVEAAARCNAHLATPADYDGALPTMVVDKTNLKGNDVKAIVCVAGDGQDCKTPAANKPVKGNQLGGTFDLTMGGTDVTGIPHDASPAQMKAKLDALPQVTNVQVARSARTRNGGFTWTVDFHARTRSWDMSKYS